MVALRRDKVSGKYSLPSGKPEDDRASPEQAGRAVEERVGSKVRLTDFAGAVHTDNGNHQVTLYWVMELSGGLDEAELNSDIEWMSPVDACARLANPSLRQLIRNAGGMTIFVDGAEERQGRLRRLLGWFAHPFRSLRTDRLLSDVAFHRRELEALADRLRERAGADLSWIPTARVLFARAAEAARQGSLDKGWKCLHAARRLQIWSYDESERKAEAAIIAEEADKLSEWRGKAVKSLIAPPEGKESPGAFALHQAALIRDEHYANQAHKDNLLKGHVLALILLLVLVAGLALLLASHGKFPTSKDMLWLSSTAETNVEQNEFLSNRLVAWVAIFGLTGAIISAMLKVPETTKQSRIPELKSLFRITILRIFMGMTSAVLLLVFLKSDFNPVGAGDLSLYSVLAVSFAAGFSERLVLRAVELVGERKR